MTLAIRQTATFAETGSGNSAVTLGSEPLDGSALILAVGVMSGEPPSRIEQDGADWNLLYDSATGEDADEAFGSVVRVQLWGAFQIAVAIKKATIVLDASVTERGFVLAEYTGDVFEFPNPADRVVGSFGENVGPGTGTLDTGVGATTRENDELWVAAAACSKIVTLTNPQSPFTIRKDEDIGGPQVGTIALLDAFTSATAALRSQVDHTTGTQVKWAITAAAIRGVLQAPFEGPEAPSSDEPVVENEDHAGDAIGHLLEQFKSHDKR